MYLCLAHLAQYADVCLLGQHVVEVEPFTANYMRRLELVTLGQASKCILLTVEWDVNHFCLSFPIEKEGKTQLTAAYLVPENMLMCTSGPGADADGTTSLWVWLLSSGLGRG